MFDLLERSILKPKQNSNLSDRIRFFTFFASQTVRHLHCELEIQILRENVEGGKLKLYFYFY